MKNEIAIVRSISQDYEMPKEDENLWLDTISFVTRWRIKVLPLQPSQRCVDSLNKICQRLASREFFLEALENWKKSPELRAEFEAIIQK